MMVATTIEEEQLTLTINEQVLQDFLDFIKSAYSISQKEFSKRCGISDTYFCNLKKGRTKCELRTKYVIIGGMMKLMEELLFVEEKTDISGFQITKYTTIDELLEFINREPEGEQKTWPI